MIFNFSLDIDIDEITYLAYKKYLNIEDFELSIEWAMNKYKANFKKDKKKLHLWEVAKHEIISKVSWKMLKEIYG